MHLILCQVVHMCDLQQPIDVTLTRCCWAVRALVGRLTNMLIAVHQLQEPGLAPKGMLV